MTKLCAASNSAPLPPPALDAKQAMGWMHTARFLTTAAQLNQLPPIDVAEIAFVGRSNAGKSTCINTLTQQRQLAFASKKPGRTQHINLFALGKQGVTDAVLADLPGYGYAAVSRTDKQRWQQVMANYLVSRKGLTGIVLLCDPRLGLTELDEALLEVVRPRVEAGLKFLVLLTKADKLTRSEQAKVLSITRLQAGGGEVRLFSALKRQGVEDVAQLPISMVPKTLPVQQPKEDKVVEALRGLVQSKAQAESIASQLPDALSVAVEKSSRLMAEDLCREAGFMLPQSGNTKAFLESIKAYPDIPTDVVDALLHTIQFR